MISLADYSLCIVTTIVRLRRELVSSVFKSFTAGLFFLLSSLYSSGSWFVHVSARLCYSHVFCKFVEHGIGKIYLIFCCSDFEDAFNIFVIIFCSFTSLSSYQTAMSSISQIDVSKLSEVDKLLEGNDDDKIRARDLLLKLSEGVSTNIWNTCL